MATIILGAVGKHFGGPIGGMIGSAIGQAIDSRIFGGKGAEGPSLKELGVQTSGYGNTIPAVFGAVRIAGSVFWATDLIERKSKSGGGKGRPSTVQYSYSASFAVALSSRPVGRVGRIWADGNLLRGSAGDFKTPTGFRFYRGDGDQVLDPLIAAAEGSAKCPAFRGICYAVFEDLQLADFGNRIPSLTFELFERETAVPVAEVASILSGGRIQSDSTETFTGYAMEGGDGRTALSPLLSNMPLILRPEGPQLGLHDWWSNSLTTSAIDIAVRSNRTALERPEYRRTPSGKLPGALALRHYEPVRDFQTGVQRSERSDAGRVATQIDFPVSLDANAARRLADLQLLQIHKSRDQWTGHAIFGSDMPNAGDWFADPGGDGRWQIVEIEHLSGASRISARRSVEADPARSYLADAGRSLPSPDLLAGTTNLVVMDLPALELTDPGKPIIAIAAAGSSAAWRSAALSLQTDTGLLEIGTTAGPAIMGNVTDILPAHSAHFLDMHNRMEVQLLHQGSEIPAGNGNPLHSGASLCWVRGELIRIGRAEFLGGNRYRLSALQRGCFGTESQISGHLAGEKLVVLDGDSLRILDGVSATLGVTLVIEALGIADATPAAASITVQGHAIRPLMPVHGKSELLENGDLFIRWIRRARVDPGWHDYVDVPQTDGEGQYNLVITSGNQPLLAVNITQSEYLITAAQLAAWDILPPDQLTFEVRQVGRYNQSLPLFFHFNHPA